MESHNKKSFKVKLNPHITIYPAAFSVDIKELGRQRAIDRMWNPDSMETRRVANEIIGAVEYGFKIGQSIYPVEKKMYTREEVKKLISKAFSSDLINSQSASELDAWMDLNVK